MLNPKTPCDFGTCPYEAEYSRDCEYWCGMEEPQDNFEEWLEEEYIEDDDEGDYEEELWNKFDCEPSRDDWDEPTDLDMGFDPYMGCYTDDC